MTPGALLLFLPVPSVCKPILWLRPPGNFVGMVARKEKGAVEKLNLIESQSKKSRLTSAVPGHNCLDVIKAINKQKLNTHHVQITTPWGNQRGRHCCNSGGKLLAPQQ